MSKNESVKRYTVKNYRSKLLRVERYLMLAAMAKTNNNMSLAYKLNCPKKQPYASLQSYKKALCRHNIV